MPNLWILCAVLLGAATVSGTVILFFRARLRESLETPTRASAGSPAAPRPIAQEVRAIGEQIERAMAEQRLQGETQRQLLTQKLDGVRHAVEDQRTQVDGLRSELRHEVSRRDAEMDEIKSQIAEIRSGIALPESARVALPPAPEPAHADETATTDEADGLPSDPDEPTLEALSFEDDSPEHATFEDISFEDISFEDVEPDDVAFEDVTFADVVGDEPLGEDAETAASPGALVFEAPLLNAEDIPALPADDAPAECEGAAPVLGQDAEDPMVHVSLDDGADADENEGTHAGIEPSAEPVSEEMEEAGEDPFAETPSDMSADDAPEPNAPAPTFEPYSGDGDPFGSFSLDDEAAEPTFAPIDVSTSPSVTLQAASLFEPWLADAESDSDAPTPPESSLDLSGTETTDAPSSPVASDAPATPEEADETDSFEDVTVGSTVAEAEIAPPPTASEVAVPEVEDIEVDVAEDRSPSRTRPGSPARLGPTHVPRRRRTRTRRRTLIC